MRLAQRRVPAFLVSVSVTVVVFTLVFEWPPGAALLAAVVISVVTSGVGLLIDRRRETARGR